MIANCVLSAAILAATMDPNADASKRRSIAVTSLESASISLYKYRSNLPLYYYVYLSPKDLPIN
jgi:hypothetical protein